MTDSAAAGGAPAFKRTRDEQDVLAARQKQYEEEAITKKYIDFNLPVLCRVDGHKFSTFTRGFKKPFDHRIHEAMVATTTDLVDYFDAVTGYTFSDEITLIFAPLEEQQAAPYNGKILKLSTLIASYACVRFAHHMRAFIADGMKPGIRKLLEDPRMSFDSRLWNVPTRMEALANVVWRSLYDCRRNGIGLLARKFYSAAKLHKAGSGKLLRLIRQAGGNWHDEPNGFKFGTYVKREQFWKEGYNPKKKQTVRCKRTRFTARSFELGGDNDGMNRSNAQMLFEKFWDGGAPEETDSAVGGSGNAASAVKATATATAAAAAGGGGGGIPAEGGHSLPAVPPTKRKATEPASTSLP